MNPHRDHEDVKDRPPLTISARAPLKLSTDDVDNGGFASRAAKQLLSVDDGGASTESEAESSYQGWSDNGW